VGDPADKGSVTGTDSVGDYDVPVRAWAVDDGGGDWLMSSRGLGTLDGVAWPNRIRAKFGGKVGAPAASSGPPVWARGLGPVCSDNSPGDGACTWSIVSLP